MMHIKESNSSDTRESSIPVWLKVLSLTVAVGDLLIVIRGYGSSATDLFGIPVSIISGIALFLLVPLMLVAVWIVFFPTSRFSLTYYWMLRFLREQITIVALFGILYLLAMRIPIVSIRGGLIWLTLLGMFVGSLLLRPTRIQEIPNYEAWRSWIAARENFSAFRSIPVWAPQLAVALLPVGLILLLIYVVIGSSLSNYGPYAQINDEVGYWVWLRSFHEIGFKSGYNVPNEMLPHFEFSRYGEQSPIYLYLYGAMINWIDWFPALPVLVNFLILSSSIFLVLRSLKLTVSQTFLAGCAILLTGPVLLYLPTTMHETLNQAIGIVLAIMIAKLLFDREGVSPAGRFGIVLFVCFATLVRVSWGLLLVPVLFYCLEGKLAWKGILSMLLGGGLFVASVVGTSYFTPPMNDTITDSVRSGMRDGLGAFIEMIRVQFYLMTESRQFSPNLGTLFQMAVVASWGVASLVHSIRTKETNLHNILHSFEAFKIYSMVSLAVAGLTFYQEKNFHRAFAPAMLIIYLLMVKRKDYRHLVALLLVSLLMFPAYRNDSIRGVWNYEFTKANYTGGIPNRSAIQTEIENYVVHDPEASNPWCNTLLTPLYFYDSRLILIPPGIGISYIMDARLMQTPLKSRYALFDQSTYQSFKDTTRLKLLVSLPIGDLYQNEDVDCPPGP